MVPSLKLKVFGLLIHKGTGCEVGRAQKNIFGFSGHPIAQFHIFWISASASIKMTTFDQVHREQKEAEKEGADVLPPLVL